MTLPKILEPLFPNSPQLDGKQDHILSPALPLTPPSNNVNNNNVIDLSTTSEEEEDYGEEEQTTPTSTALVLHENPLPSDASNNYMLIVSVEHDEANKEYASISEIDDDNSNTVVLTASPQDIKQEEDESEETLVEDERETLVEDERVLTPPALQEFTEPIQATTEIQKKQEEEEITNFALQTTFKKSSSTGSFRSKCMQMFCEIKKRTQSIEKKRNRMKSKFAASSGGRMNHNNINTSLERSASIVAVISAEGPLMTPIYDRNCNQSIISFEEDVPYVSPDIGSDAHDIKILCDQLFFGRY